MKFINSSVQIIFSVLNINILSTNNNEFANTSWSKFIPGFILTFYSLRYYQSKYKKVGDSAHHFLTSWFDYHNKTFLESVYCSGISHTHYSKEWYLFVSFWICSFWIFEKELVLNFVPVTIFRKQKEVEFVISFQSVFSSHSVSAITKLQLINVSIVHIIILILYQNNVNRVYVRGHIQYNFIEEQIHEMFFSY